MVEFPDIKEAIEDELENILNNISKKHNIDISILLQKHLPSRFQNTKSKNMITDDLGEYRKRKQLEWERLEREEEEKEAQINAELQEKQSKIAFRMQELRDKLCKLYTDPIIIEQEIEYAIEHGYLN